MRAEARTASLFHRITQRAVYTNSRLRPHRPQTFRESILLNTMPKSGSVYVCKSLAKILTLRTMYIGNQYGLIDQIDVKDAHTFSAGRKSFTETVWRRRLRICRSCSTSN